MAEATKCLDAAELIEDQQRGRYRRRVDSQGRRWYGHLLVVKVLLIGVLAGAWSAVKQQKIAAATTAAAGVVALPLAVSPAQQLPAPATPSGVEWGGDEYRPPVEVLVEEPQAPAPRTTLSEPSPASATQTRPGPGPELSEWGTEPVYATKTAAPLGEGEQREPEATSPPTSPAPLPEPPVIVEPTLPPKVDPEPAVELTPEQLCLEAGFGGVHLNSCLKRLERGGLVGVG